MALNGEAMSPMRIAEAEAALAAGWSLPYAWMGDASLHQFETERIFERSWHVAGLESKVAAPGARLVLQVGRVPVLVVRGEDGELRGFVNVCRHRGYRVALEDSCSRLLMCRYHAWTYELDGRLRRAPGAEDIPGFDPEELSLIPVSVDTWRGIVFVNTDPHAASLLQSYSELEDTAAAAGFDLRSYRPFRTFELQIRSDWKLVYDNAVECYHCPSMHGKTLNLLYASDGFEGAVWKRGMRYAQSTLKGSNGTHHAFQLFPGAMLIMDPVIGVLAQFAPSAPGMTHLRVDYLAAPAADAETVTTFVDLWSATLTEDKEICELQQRGVASGRVDCGRLISGREDSLPGVQALILAAYRDGISSAGWNKRTPGA